MVVLTTWMLIAISSISNAQQFTSSKAKHNLQSCLACQSDPTLCTLRSGFLRQTHLPLGLNFVTTLPRGACNVNITELAVSSNHLAVRTHADGHFILNGGAKGALDWPAEYPVDGSVFSYSHAINSQTNGNSRGQVLWSPGPINEALDVMVVVNHRNPGIKYQYHVSVPRNAEEYSSTPSWNNDPDEVAWNVVGFTSCTQPCGGEQESVLACMRGAQATLPPSHCDGLPQPEDVILPCNTEACPAQWEAAEWSPCAATCGEATQTRVVICRQHVSASLVVKVDDSACEETPPERVRLCHLPPCPRWMSGEWSPCSLTCGQGVRQRTVWCSSASEKCAKDIKPTHRETCNAGLCEVAMSSSSSWLFTDWSRQCSTSCGSGTMHRRVRCWSPGVNEVNSLDCDHDDKPTDTRSCYSDSGCSTAWFHGPWEKCPEACEIQGGPAYQIRSVVCVHRVLGQWRIVSDSRCAHQDRPNARRACHHHLADCPPQWFTSAWNHCVGPCGSRHRKRDVRCLDWKQEPSNQCQNSTRPHDSEKCHHESLCETQALLREDPDTSICHGSDTLRNCGLVVQARLCEYPYYRRACCHACTKYFRKTGSNK